MPNPFMAPEVEELPRLACLGYIAKVKDGVVSTKGLYSMVPFEISPMESGKKAFGNFLFRPEWLEPGYNPDQMKQYDEPLCKSMTTVYRMNIAVKGSVPLLAGIAGSEDDYYELAARLQSIEGQKTPDVVAETIREFVNEVNPTVGYILKQKSKKNDEGKYELENGYEIGNWFWPTEEARAGLAKSAANGKLVLTFEV